MNKNTAQYDPFAEHFSQTRQRPWPEFQLLLPHIPKKARVADVGCGNGRLRESLPYDLVPEGQYFGLDESENLLAIARERNPQDHFFWSNFNHTWPFGADQFDVIAAVASFHHITDRHAQRRFLHEAYRTLRPGGTLFLTTWILPKKYFWPNVLRGRFWNWHVPFGPQKHPRVYRRVGPKGLSRLLRFVGFTVSHAAPFENRNVVCIAHKPKNG